MIENISQLQNYLLTSVPKNFKKKYTENWGLDNVKKFLEFIGNPQEEQPTIHVSGTSGKGSTSYFVATLLEKQGFKVGLHVSPFVLDFRESFLINGQLLDTKIILKSFDQFRLKYESFTKKLTYHELKTCFAYYFFNFQKVDYVVMETGMGGTYDSTNVVIRSDKICLINQIGYDHQEFLGNKISQIADEETGIIGHGNWVVFVQQEYKTSTKIVQQKAKNYQAKLYEVVSNDSLNSTKNTTFKNEVVSVSNIQSTLKGTVFDYQFEDNIFSKLITKNLGDFQAKNAALAITGVILASKIHQFKLNPKAIYTSLNETIFPARMQLTTLKQFFKTKIIKDHPIIVDGAHNNQKIEALVSNLLQIYSGKKFTILCGFSGDRDPKPMLKELVKISDLLILTQFTNEGLKSVGKESVANHILEKSLKEIGFKNSVTFEKLDQGLDYFKNNISEIGLITGSFYLCGEVLKNID